MESSDNTTDGSITDGSDSTTHTHTHNHKHQEVGGGENGTEVNDKGNNVIKNKILYVLWLYPKISMSMLQVGIGTALAPALWKPILNKLLEDEVVIQDTQSFNTPTGRQQSHSFLSINPVYQSKVYDELWASPSTANTETV